MLSRASLQDRAGMVGDGVELARQASLAGSDVTLRVWARMIHIFPWFHTQLLAGRTAIAQGGMDGRCDGREVALDNNQVPIGRSKPETRRAP
jgi:hypothetical protein